MSTVAPAERRAQPAPTPPVRHGLCRLTLTIDGTEYRLSRSPTARAAWHLKNTPDPAPVSPTACSPTKILCHAHVMILSGAVPSASTSAPSRPSAWSRAPSPKPSSSPEPGHRHLAEGGCPVSYDLGHPADEGGSFPPISAPSAASGTPPTPARSTPARRPGPTRDPIPIPIPAPSGKTPGSIIRPGPMARSPPRATTEDMS